MPRSLAINIRIPLPTSNVPVRINGGLYWKDFTVEHLPSSASFLPSAALIPKALHNKHPTY